jgi:L-lactate dehydrogenase complex protein LldF
VNAYGYLPLAKRLSFAVAGHVFGNPAEYRAMENVAQPAMDYAPHFLLYNRTVNPWGRDRELPQLAKETFREWYLANRSEHANVQQ